MAASSIASMHFLAMDRASGHRHARVVSSDAVTGAQPREILCWSRAAEVQSDRFHKLISQCKHRKGGL